MKKIIASIGLLVLIMFGAVGCDGSSTPQSSSGVTQASAQVTTGSDGLTVEQRNVRDRLTQDNKPGSIKHLYVISAYSGQVIFYSTVKGKVTSSGKRLTPTTVNENISMSYCHSVRVDIAGIPYCTPEVLQDDGTYGSSVDYVYWFDVQGRYHQLYVTGGMILTISDQPIPVKSITINMEEAKQ